MSLQFLTYNAVFVMLLTPISGTKWLLDNPGFDSPEAWVSESLPCALEEVVFPENYDAVLPLSRQVHVSGFVLPRDGAILLKQEAEINLGGELTGRECSNGRSQKAYLNPPSVKKWLDPLSWRSTATVRDNKAVPDMERVPCNNESVVIQANGPLALDLENAAYLRVGQLSLAGSLISKEYLESLIGSDIGQLLFKHSKGVRVQYYHNDICGCHRDYAKFVEPICQNIVEKCERPHCLVPITPYESCCSICGAALKFSMERCDDTNLNKLRKVITKAIKEQDLTDDLDYHVNYINMSPYGNVLQAIIVDRVGYREKSVAFAQRLQSTTNWKKLFAHQQLEVEFSGRAYNPNVTFGSILLIILCLMLVTVVALVIFAHYAPDSQYLNYIPQWVYDPRRWRALFDRSTFARFARFDNGGTNAASAENDMQEHIIMGYDAENDEVRERAFDNPMFEERPLKELTANPRVTTSAFLTSATEKDKSKKQVLSGQSSEQKLDVTLAAIRVGAMEEEEQELTEIKLEASSDDDSSDEKETKEN